MLKGIDKVISPKLLEVLASMGHGDTLVIGDCNYAGESNSNICIRADGIDATVMLDAILKLFPIDDDDDGEQVLLMDHGDKNRPDPIIWSDFKKIVIRHQPKTQFKTVQRKDFYTYARNSFATVLTGESKPYACIIIRKGYI